MRLTDGMTRKLLAGSGAGFARFGIVSHLIILVVLQLNECLSVKVAR